MKNRIILLTAAVVLNIAAHALNFETDREWYLAGEPMKVSITANDAMIAYAELCDTHGMAAGCAVSVNGGKGEGVIELPIELHSGYYVLSVYTRHEAEVAHRLVAVVNPLRKSKDDDIDWIAADNCYVSNSGTAELITRKGIGAKETEGHIVKARIKNGYNGKTYADAISASLSIVGKQIHYFEGKMENDSTVVFYTYGIHGRLPLVLTAITKTGESLPVELISPFETLLPKKLPRLVFSYNRSEVETRSMDMQRCQMSMKPTSALLLDYDDNVLGTKPDLTYNLDEYRQFLTIREVMLEYVTNVSKRKINGVQKLMVLKDVEPYQNFVPSLVLIDGMPVLDTERLLKYDARRIHYINIYGGQYTFGNTVYNGILSFVTRSGQLTNYPVEHNMQYLVYDFP